MRKLLLAALLLIPVRLFADVSTGTVLVIDKIAPKNGAFTGLVNAENVDISTNTFSGNLGTGDTNLQTALQTIDGLSVGGGSGVSVYPATATASFPVGLDASTMTITDIHASGNIIADGVIGSTTGAFAYQGSTVTYDAPPIDTVDRIPILNNGAVSWDAAVTDGARLGSTQTFTGANVFGSSVSLTGLPGAGVLYADANGLISTTTAGGGSGDIEGVTVTDPVTGGGTSGTVAIGLNQISLSTGVVGTLTDSFLSANVPLLDSTQTFTGANTFSGAVEMSSGTTISASTITLTDVAMVLVGTMTINGDDICLESGVNCPSLGGGISSLAVTTGVAGGFTTITSSPTAAINFSSDTFSVALTGSATAYVDIASISDDVLSANVALLNSTQTFTGENTFSGAVEMSSGTTISASTVTLTDVALILSGNSSITWPDATVQVSSPSAGAGSGDIEGVTAGYGLTGGGTTGTPTLNLDPDTTSYIQNRDTLQTGTTAFPALLATNDILINGAYETDARITILDTDENLDKPVMRHFAIDTPWTGDMSLYQFYTGPSTATAALNGELIFRNVASGSGVNERPVGFSFLDGLGAELFSVGGDVDGHGGPHVPSAKLMRWFDSDNSNYVGFKASATVATSVDWTLPAADGSSGQPMKTDGSGNLSFGDLSLGAVADISQQTVLGRAFGAGTGEVTALTYAQFAIWLSTANSITSTTNSVAWNSDNAKTFMHTLTENTTIAATSGTPFNGQTVVFHVTQAAGNYTLSWNAQFVAGDTFTDTIPAVTTVSGGVSSYIFFYSSTLSKYVLLGHSEY